MAFLFQDQNQGIRNDAPHGDATVATVLFHPDYTVGFGFTPNLLTLPLARKALAGLGLFTLTAGGDFHPALRTSATRYERPNDNYAQAPLPEQAGWPWSIRMCP